MCSKGWGAMCGGRDPGSLICEPKDKLHRRVECALSDSTFLKSPMVEEPAEGCRDHDDDTNKTVNTAGMGKGTECDSVA